MYVRYTLEQAVKIRDVILPLTVILESFDLLLAFVDEVLPIAVIDLEFYLGNASSHHIGHSCEKLFVNNTFQDLRIVFLVGNYFILV